MIPGSFILLVHDIGDFFLVSGRAYLDYKNRNKTVEKVVMGIVILVWIHSRLYLYPRYSYYAGFMLSVGVIKSSNPAMQFLKFGNMYMICMITLL